MWEINEGDTSFLYAMKLMPRKDLESICRLGTFHFVHLGTIRFANFFYHSPNTLEHTLIFLKCMVNEHVFMNLISINKKFNPHNFETHQNSVCFKH